MSQAEQTNSLPKSDDSWFHGFKLACAKCPFGGVLWFTIIDGLERLLSARVR